MTQKTAKVIGTHNDSLVLFSEPVHRPAQAGDVIELDGTYWRLFGNGQRLRGHDVTAQALDALAARLVPVIAQGLRAQFGRVAEREAVQ